MSLSLTVREAIEQLQRFDGDMLVRVALDGGASEPARDVGRYDHAAESGPIIFGQTKRAGELPIGTKVEHAERIWRFADSPITHPLEGEVIGYDADLSLPLIEWEDGSGPEACYSSEFKIKGTT